MELVVKDDSWRIPDELWKQMEPLLRVVERTHSWMNRFRRILIRWEKRADTYIAMLHFACGIITWRATGLLG